MVVVASEKLRKLQEYESKIMTAVMLGRPSRSPEIYGIEIAVLASEKLRNLQEWEMTFKSG
jgi:hypothetical protein